MTTFKLTFEDAAQFAGMSSWEAVKVPAASIESRTSSAPKVRDNYLKNITIGLEQEVDVHRARNFYRHKAYRIYTRCCLLRWDVERPILEFRICAVAVHASHRHHCRSMQLKMASVLHLQQTKHLVQYEVVQAKVSC